MISCMVRPICETSAQELEFLSHGVGFAQLAGQGENDGLSGGRRSDVCRLFNYAY
jgi:hypothetical protein